MLPHVHKYVSIDRKRFGHLRKRLRLRVIEHVCQVVVLLDKGNDIVDTRGHQAYAFLQHLRQLFDGKVTHPG